MNSSLIINDHAARACYQAAVCLEATVFALMSIQRELERHVRAHDAESAVLNVLVRLIDPVNELEVEAAEEFERLTGQRHPILDPY